jgi:hypothetical protein
MVTLGTAIVVSVGIIGILAVGVGEFAFSIFVITASLWVSEGATELKMDVWCVFIPLSGLGHLPFHMYCLIAIASCL